MSTMTPPPFTVNIAQSFEMGTVAWQQQVFVKLYTVALATGFFAHISDRDWKTLCVLALHMDAQGQCYPSRDAIARALGVNKSTASDRIQHLLDFRWQDQPLVQATRERCPDGTLGRQVYTILPIAPFGFGSDHRGPDPEALPSGDASAAVSTMSGNGDMVENHHVGVSQLGFTQLGKSRPLQTRSRINEIQGKPDPGSRDKDLPPDPSTPAESSDLTPQGVPARKAMAVDSPVVKSVARGNPQDALCQPRSTTPDVPSRRSATVLPDCREENPLRGGALEFSDPQSKTGHARSPEAKALAERLKDSLQARGVTIFPRDWSLKAQASADHLLRFLSVAEVEALMDWALHHPFWGPRTTTMHRLVTLAAEWQQSQTGEVMAPVQRSSPSHRPATVADRNMALLRRLYASATAAQEGDQHDASG